MAKKKSTARRGPSKQAQLDQFRDQPEGAFLTTDQGVRVASTDDSLKAGERGPTLLEDFHLREKITRFDHERIPERVVHARGAGAHGFFQVYEPLTKLTRAAFLQDPAVKTPVFVRFSTVVGSRGSADTARDVRGFAVKFYTSEGNFDLVGNNMPVFFIQDGIKFPDLIHAVKPEPASEIPQAASAHDTFWDFVSLTPETTHMVLWVMSDRAIPRSYRHMEGFGVHTFRLVNAQGKAVLVKWHWKPVLGAHSLVWDEASKLMGKDADFHRRDLFDSIERGDLPEFELGLQVVKEEDVLRYGFDLLDATKLLPEELVPVRLVGKLTLDRNPTNYFAEVEQVAFCVGNVVPGVDFTNDPLLQARLFSYLDTQLTRLGGPNFAELPINRPVAPVTNHQSDGHMRTTVNTGAALYHPNSVGLGQPTLAKAAEGAFVHHAERVDGHKIRARSESFKDHFSQATMFFHSLSDVEQLHIVEALRFELGKVVRKEIRARVLGLLTNVDPELAQAVAQDIGVPVPKTKGEKKVAPPIEQSPALSLLNAGKPGIRTRCVAVLVADGVDGDAIAELKKALAKGGARAELVNRTLAPVKTLQGDALEPDKSHLTAASVFYDAVFVPGGKKAIEAQLGQGDAIHFVNEAFRHAKTIGATDEALDLLEATAVGETISLGKTGKVVSELGVVTGQDATAKVVKAFTEAMALHRHWERDPDPVPA
jgi:catalase